MSSTQGVKAGKAYVLIEALDKTGPVMKQINARMQWLAQQSAAAGAKAFADFMVSKETQDIVKTFGVDKFGSPLFFPDAGKKEEDLGK